MLLGLGITMGLMSGLGTAMGLILGLGTTKGLMLGVVGGRVRVAWGVRVGRCGRVGGWISFMWVD